MGHGGWWTSPKQKYTVRYAVAPNVQNPFKGMVQQAVFNTFRRVRSQFLFVLIPVGTYAWLWNWAGNYNEWLYTKAGAQRLKEVS